jgi:ABC-type Fe3+/spermidine/putrescine transport system ATPase subunit
MLLDVIAISKSFGHAAVLRSVSLQVDARETVCLLGPSGCGKTTLLRTIAGLEAPDSGKILLEGHSLEDVPVHERGFGLMFQDYALFPHKDVEANVAFGLRMQRLAGPQVRARVGEMLELVGLAGYERRRVFDLSGGEQQRVALARSLAPRPRLLMLDEPLGSLDRALREELLREVRAILRRVGVTSIYVTHDQQEAFTIAGRVLIMDKGRILQQGTPEAVYRQPASAWVARFLGLANLVPGRVVRTDPLEVETRLGRFRPLPASPGGTAPGDSPAGALPASTTREGTLAPGQPVTLLIRPEAARLEADCPSQDTRLLEAVVQEYSFRGAHYRLVIRHESGQVLAFEVAPGAASLPRPGEQVALALTPQAIGVLIEQEEAPE